jgi:phosphotransferase system HPr (HPr) family protein
MRVKDVHINKDFSIPSIKKFIAIANRFQSDIKIESYDESFTIDAKSILGLASIFFKNGKEIMIKAQGDDEEEAIKALGEFMESLFNEK